MIIAFDMPDIVRPPTTRCPAIHQLHSASPIAAPASHRLRLAEAAAFYPISAPARTPSFGFILMYVF
jgi:hypothetical protein